MTGQDILDEIYQRLRRSGPEYGGDEQGDNGLTNHGPMAVEVMIRRGLDVDVHRWLDRYVRRLTEVPAATDPITGETWREALGGGARRVGDWTDFFRHRLAERPWRSVLAEWWPRLGPGIAAGSTHGVIRVGHAVRVLLAGRSSPEVLGELAHGMAFWAARYRPVPGAGAPAGRLPIGAALDAVPRLPEQTGLIAQRLARLDGLPGWPRAIRAAAVPDDIPSALADLVHAATVRYLDAAPASPVLLVHTATAPNAVLHTLPALPRDLWLPSYGYAWSATAAITATYAPATTGRRHPGTETPSDALDRAARHGDEHVIKFTDTAVEVYERTEDPTALAAARRAAELIERP